MCCFKVGAWIGFRLGWGISWMVRLWCWGIQYVCEGQKEIGVCACVCVGWAWKQLADLAVLGQSSIHYRAWDPSERRPLCQTRAGWTVSHLPVQPASLKTREKKNKVKSSPSAGPSVGGAEWNVAEEPRKEEKVSDQLQTQWDSQRLMKRSICARQRWRVHFRLSSHISPLPPAPPHPHQFNQNCVCPTQGCHTVIQFGSVHEHASSWRLGEDVMKEVHG